MVGDELRTNVYDSNGMNYSLHSKVIYLKIKKRSSSHHQSQRHWAPWGESPGIGLSKQTNKQTNRQRNFDSVPAKMHSMSWTLRWELFAGRWVSRATHKEELKTQRHLHIFCPRCVLNFVRIINCVSKLEDELAPWPLVRGHNSSEGFPAAGVIPQLPTPLPILLTPLKRSKGRKGEWGIAGSAGLGCGAESPSPPSC